MKSHFLFEPGTWLGAGSVTLSVSPELLYYRTRWNIDFDEERALFRCVQHVEIVGGDQMVNIFDAEPKNAASFEITLRNDALGVFGGQGVQEEMLIAWEFREPGALEGYEVYERVHDDEYSMHAEYISQDGARTMIRGKLWKGAPRYE